MSFDNREFQSMLKGYPEDAVIALQVRFNGERELLTELTVDGIKFLVGEKELKMIVIGSKDLDMEYEALLNGSDFDETVYRER